MQRAGTMSAATDTRMTPSSRAFYAVIAAVVRRASLRTKKALVGRTDAVTKKNPKRIDARGVASMCKLETEQQGGRGMGCRPVSACCKYNSQAQIAFHQPQRHTRSFCGGFGGYELAH